MWYIKQRPYPMISLLANLIQNHSSKYWSRLQEVEHQVFQFILIIYITFPFLIIKISCYAGL